MCDDKTVRLEEYKTLRDEILNNQRLRLQILILCITATGVIIGLPPKLFGRISETLPSLKPTGIYPYFLPALALYAVLIPSCFISRILSDRIQFIGAYLAVYIEETLPALNWERNAYKIRPSLAPRAITTGIATAYLALAIVASLFTATSLATVKKSQSGMLVIIFSLCSALLGTEVLWLWRGKGAKERHIKDWRKQKVVHLVEIKEARPERRAFTWFVARKYAPWFVLFFFLSFVLLYLFLRFIV